MGSWQCRPLEPFVGYSEINIVSVWQPCVIICSRGNLPPAFCTRPLAAGGDGIIAFHYVISYYHMVIG